MDAPKWNGGSAKTAPQVQCWSATEISVMLGALFRLLTATHRLSSRKIPQIVAAETSALACWILCAFASMSR
jgi:hypothetical protein